VKIAKTWVGLVVLQLTFVDADANFCPVPSLVSSLENSDIAFVGRLVEAKVAEDYSASGRFTLLETLKGNVSESVSFTAEVNNGMNCGLELSLGKAYLVFVRQNEVQLSIVTGTRLIGDQPAVLQWILDVKNGRRAT
jgi:hypothetical protein